MSMKKSQYQLKLSFKQIEDATNNFETCIGKGGYGLVYKGELSINGKLTEVAVKRLNEQFGQGLKEFLTEIELLSGQEHENLISLIGYCDEGEEKVLVYEYAKRGSLYQYTSPCGTYTLTWLERLKICVGAARGLDHLHNHVGEHQSIIHRDIKSANILLDAKGVAKISDLGLSKLSLAGFGRSEVVSRACGTPGYCEPEYITSGIVTKESDVYSLGVVLFEVLLGRSGTVHGFVLSAGSAKEYYELRKLDDIIEPGLRKQMSKLSLNIFSTTAYKCLHDDRRLRPPMDLVVKELERSLKIQEEYELGEKKELKNNSLNDYWKIKLPDDVDDIIKGLDPALVYATRKELFSLLREGLFFHHNHRFFFLNNDGIKCEMISAHTFLEWKSRRMIWDDDVVDTCIFKSRDGEYLEPGSCSVMGQYPHVKALNVHCQISTSMLSLGIMYSANLVFSFGKWEDRNIIPTTTNCVWIKWQCQDLRVSRAHYAQELEDTSEGNKFKKVKIMKATLWHFVHNDKNANFDIVINRILGGVEDIFPYIVIHGFIFQPVDMKKPHTGTIIQEGALISWKKNTPGDYEKIIARSHTDLKFKNKKELYLLLCRGILIDNGQKWFSICNSTGGKVCLVLPDITILWYYPNHKLLKPVPVSGIPNHKLLERLSLSESRLKNMIRLQRLTKFSMEIEIEPEMLSPGRVYACYFIFKFEDLQTTPQDTCVLRAHYYWDSRTMETHAHLKLLKPINTPIIKPTKNNRFRDSGNIPKTKDSFMSKEKINYGESQKFAEQRDDGWLEVPLFQNLYRGHGIDTSITFKCIEGNLKGVIFQGIEFRPIQKDPHSPLGRELSRIFINWARGR